MKNQTTLRTITISPTMLMIGLIVPGVVLLALSVGVNIVFFQSASPDPTTKMWLFDANYERSFYTWYSTLLHIGIAVLLLLTALEKWQLRDRLTVFWAGLAIVFVETSADEMLSLHERMEKIGAMIDPGVAPGAGWVVPVGLVCLVGLVPAVIFLRSLPRPIAMLMAASAVIFVGGAIGLELVSGELYFRDGLKGTLGAEMWASAEEGLEVAGLLLFIHTLLLYRRRHMLRLPIRIG